MTTANQPAWTDADLAANPHEAADKAKRVRDMFSAIAPSYDLNNRVHSMGRDQAWRRKAVQLAVVKPNDSVLDVACGTGDLTLAFSDALSRKRVSLDSSSPQQPIIGLDFTFEMLMHAHRKSGHNAMSSKSDSVSAKQGEPVSWIHGDAMRLPLADQSVDIVSIAFGIRNVSIPSQAIAEFYRVLRPGGRLIILEFSLPRNRLLRGMYNFYFKHIMPRTASLIARDRSGAYKYLPRSVNTFIDRKTLIGMMETAGFADVSPHPLTFGVAVVYRGVKP